MKRLLYTIITALCAICVSCNKNTIDGGNQDGGSDGQNGGGNGTNPPSEIYGEFELAEDAVFMTEDMTSIFGSVEDGKIIVPDAISQESVPGIGTVIICPITEKTPSGLLVKITSVQKDASGYTLVTEPATLEEAFDELHVDAAVDMAPFLMHAIDKDGNMTEPEFLTEEEWDAIMLDDVEPESKVSVSHEFTPVSFPIEAGEFNGSLYIRLELEAKIDISRTMDVKSFEFNITRTTGIGGGWDVNKNGEWGKTYFEKELVFKPIPVPNTPLVLIPKFYTEVGAKAQGTAKFKADVSYIFERQTYSASSAEGGTPVFTCINDPKVNEESFRFHHLTLDGQAAISATAGGKLCVYNESILAVGGELSGDAIISASAGVSMEDKEMLIKSPEVVLNVGLEASVYAESMLFRLFPDNDDGRVSKDFELPIASLAMHALPAYSDLERSSTKTAKSISGRFEMFSMIICEEKGFAFFEEGASKALKHIAISKGGKPGEDTRVIELPKEEGSASFTVPDPDKMYEIKPYAKAYGIYFYGEGEFWVDLGLPSGILWAKYNVGANSPEEYGGYYAWGETEEKESYAMDTYTHAFLQK